MKNTVKAIMAVVVIAIILGAVGAYVYINSNNSKPGPTPEPTASPAPIKATLATNNQTISIGLSGNVTASQISNMTITPSQSSSTTLVQLNFAGQSGTVLTNMSIPKTAISYGMVPTVYIDSQQAQNQGYSQDTDNFYVWYWAQSNAHIVTITFVPSTSSPTPNPTASSSPPSTASPTPVPTPTPIPTPTTLTVATTTSLHDTGLEDNGINGNTTGTLKSAFQAEYPWITVNFVALGTGAAIAQAEAGDADMILVHSPSQELSFLTGGYGVDRKIIAFNFFVIVGPASDPAGIHGMTNVNQALTKLYTAAQSNSSVQWFTRNDGSGTATAESNLWKAAGYSYTTLVQNTTWFHSTGQGMGQTLLIANNGIGGGASGYCLSDMGTYLAYYDSGNIQLKIQIQAQQALLNVYSAIIDNPQNANLTHTNFAASLLFENFLVSDAGQQLIANFGVSTYGQSLFTPFVPYAINPSLNTTLLTWIQGYAYINANNVISPSGTECPPQYRYNAGSLYSLNFDIQLANMNLNPSISYANNYSTDGQQPMLAQPATNSQSGKLNKV